MSGRSWQKATVEAVRAGAGAGVTQGSAGPSEGAGEGSGVGVEAKRGVGEEAATSAAAVTPAP